MDTYSKSISPIDGRYKNYVIELEDIGSEYAYTKYRLMVEVEYVFKFLIYMSNKNCPFYQPSIDYWKIKDIYIKNLMRSKHQKLKKLKK